MSDVTQLLEAAAAGDPRAGAQLLPLVYAELRKLAAARMAQEPSGHTLDATALVHEAYLRLVDGAKPPAAWNGRGHFFAAAAEAMRRILVERARRRRAAKRGGHRVRVPLADVEGRVRPDDELLAIDEALDRLAAEDPAAARFVQLRYFAGMTAEDAAEVIGLSRSSAYEHWAYAKARLRCLLGSE